jgi:UDP-N-acetylglucosamine 2-epimerase (non-hydrolysing)
MVMKNLKVLTIFGTRPEAVKMAPVIHTLQMTPHVETHICVTAQHREMLDQVLSLFDITPEIDLDLMKPGQELAALTSDIFQHVDPILTKLNPDWVLVQGDTTTVMAASIAAYYRRIHVGHVEAGLRTHDKWQPFPEEINRRIAGVVADLHLAPTPLSRRNLLSEGIPDWRIVITGNPVIDALHHISQLPIPTEIRTLLQQHAIHPGGKKLILITAHRRENFGKPIENICEAIRTLAAQYLDAIHFVYPVHLNPNIKQPVYRLLSNLPNVSLLPPLEYLPLVHLLKNATLVLTDSGGIQEEATGLGIPALVLRQVTERPEGIEAGVLKLVGTDTRQIVSEVIELLNHPEEYQKMTHASNPFGDGHAAEKIVQALLNYTEPAA